MDGLRLFGNCDDAARYFSKHEPADVVVICADGSKHVYIEGEDREIPWLAAPMPLQPLGQPVTSLDMTPVEVQLGRWSDEAENFIHSRTMSVEDFLNLAGLSKRTA